MLLWTSGLVREVEFLITSSFSRHPQTVRWLHHFIPPTPTPKASAFRFLYIPAKTRSLLFLFFYFSDNSHSEGVACCTPVVPICHSPMARDAEHLSAYLLDIPWVFICITSKWDPTSQVPVSIQVESSLPRRPVGDWRVQHGPLPAWEGGRVCTR